MSHSLSAAPCTKMVGMVSNKNKKTVENYKNTQPDKNQKTAFERLAPAVPHPQGKKQGQQPYYSNGCALKNRVQIGELDHFNAEVSHRDLQSINLPAPCQTSQSRWLPAVCPQAEDHGRGWGSRSRDA